MQFKWYITIARKTKAYNLVKQTDCVLGVLISLIQEKLIQIKRK